MSDAAATDATATTDPEEIARFDALAADWWRADGPMAPLHAMNPARLAFIRSAVSPGAGAMPARPLAGCRALDVGTGAGLLAEPLARMGAGVVAIDAGREVIAAARRHAGNAGFSAARSIDYRVATAAELAARPQRFDLVTALEVVEHVPDPAGFVAELAALLAPGGTLVMSTLNRTSLSYLAAIVGAERITRTLPRGTHAWRRFVRPSELAAHLRAAGLTPMASAGLLPDPAGTGFRLSRRRLAVNYLMSARL